MEELRQQDFPTRVGMARHTAPMAPGILRFPHPRGDGPPGLIGGDHGNLISPPAWGWPAGTLSNFVDAEDFPTRVGMARWR